MRGCVVSTLCAHLDQHCLVTGRAAASDPWQAIGMLTNSAICSPPLASGSSVLPYCENTPGDPHQFYCMTKPARQTHQHTHHKTMQCICTDCSHQMHSQSVPNNHSCSPSTCHGCRTAALTNAQIYSTQK